MTSLAAPSRDSDDLPAYDTLWEPLIVTIALAILLFATW